jgi:hypothetical protein
MTIQHKHPFWKKRNGIEKQKEKSCKKESEENS